LGAEGQGAQGVDGSRGISQPNAGSSRATQVPAQDLLASSQGGAHELGTPVPPHISGGVHCPQSRI